MTEDLHRIGNLVQKIQPVQNFLALDVLEGFSISSSLDLGYFLIFVCSSIWVLENNQIGNVE